jgi:hypothetical protein
MSVKREPLTVKGRTLGIATLTAAQILIGVIHIISGLLLLGSEISLGSNATIVYDIYTTVYGALTLIFGLMIWQSKKLGWAGTIAVSLFVIVADALTILNLPSIPGIPRSAGALEIAYSVVVVFYLLLPEVRKKFRV